MLLKPIIPFGTSLKKLKKRQAIALAARRSCGGLGLLWVALAEVREALGEHWECLEELRESSEGLYI